MSTFTKAQVQAIIDEALVVAEQAAVDYFNTHLGGVDRFACGFAWTTVYGVKGSTKLGKLLLESGFSKAYQGGLQYWMPARSARMGFVQNVDTHLEGARAFAKVLKEKLGVECYADSRLD